MRSTAILTQRCQRHARLPPKPADWPVLLSKIGHLVSRKAPTLMVFVDADAVRAHMPTNSLSTLAAVTPAGTDRECPMPDGPFARWSHCQQKLTTVQLLTCSEIL